MNKLFSAWTLADLQSAISEAAIKAEPLLSLTQLRAALPAAESRPYVWLDLGAERNRLYFLGDHWQDGAGWAGPRPSKADSAYLSVMEEIKLAFVSKNAIREVIRRHRNGVIGKEPSWKVTLRRPLKDGEAPTAQEQALIDEAEAALVNWWDRRGVHGQLQEATDTLLWAGRGYIRLFVPPGAMASNGTIPRGSLEESFNRLWVSLPDPTQAAMPMHSATRAEAGVYLEADREAGGLVGEMSWIDENGRTVLRRLSQESEETEATLLPLGGRLMLAEMTREPFITPQVREHQALLNMALTMLSRNVVLGGFLERVILNAQLPGKYMADPDNPKLQKFVPEPFHVGAGTTNSLVGIPMYDAAGNVTGYTNPSINYRDPVPTDTFQSTRSLAYQGILEEADQLHVLMAGDATASGESRKQALGQFEQSLESTQTALNKAGRWLLETALSLAAYFSGAPGRFDALRIDFNAEKHLGPISALEVDGVIKKQSAGLISRETARMEIGIDDPAAEDAKIAQEMEAGMTRQVALQRKLGLVPTGEEETPDAAEEETPDAAKTDQKTNAGAGNE